MPGFFDGGRLSFPEFFAILPMQNMTAQGGKNIDERMEETDRADDADGCALLRDCGRR